MPKDMGQTPIEGDDSHDEFFYDTASTSERDILLRAFPDPLPLGHRIVHRWDYSKGPGKLMVRVEKVESAEPQYMDEMKEKSAELVKALGAPALDLGKLSEQDLETAGAELGLTFPKKANLAAKRAMVAKAREARAAEAAA
jgi:hypothetical protein